MSYLFIREKNKIDACGIAYEVYNYNGKDSKKV